MRKDQSQVPGQRVQLHRALSKLGLGSRTQAWDWIQAGRVAVDGRVVTDPLTWVDLQRQAITRDGLAATPRQHLTLALHKPRGVITTASEERQLTRRGDGRVAARQTVYDLLPADLPWVFPAGRLDADSEGLLILTSDSEPVVAPDCPGPRHPQDLPRHPVRPTHSRSAGAAAPRRRSLRWPDAPRRGLRPGPGRRGTLLEIVLTEGRNRQIRRMAAAIGQRVWRLMRVAIGAYQLGDLPAGQYRQLTDEDKARLLATEVPSSGGRAAHPREPTGPFSS